MPRKRTTPLLDPTPSTVIVAASLALGLDHDLGPSERWLRAIGATVRCSEDRRELTWTNAPGVNAGGLTVDIDPATACVQLLFATLGQLWPLCSVGPAQLKEVNARWKQRTKAEKGA